MFDTSLLSQSDKLSYLPKLQVERVVIFQPIEIIILLPGQQWLSIIALNFHGDEEFLSTRPDF